MSFTLYWRDWCKDSEEVGRRVDQHNKFSCSYDFAETGTAKDQRCNASLPKSMNKTENDKTLAYTLFVFENIILYIFFNVVSEF